MIEKAIIFDLDGTLWDALNNITISYNLVMKKHNLPYSFSKEVVRFFMGLTPIETVNIAFKDVSVEEGLNYFKLIYEGELEYLKDHPGTLYPNEIEVLSSLYKKYPLFIVSNSDKGYIENYLSSLNMEQYFVDHLCAGDTGLEKWQNILEIIKKHEISEVIYVGDTKKDQIESQKAGVHFIHAAYGFGKIEDAIYKINSLDDLESVIEKVFKNETF